MARRKDEYYTYKETNHSPRGAAACVLGFVSMIALICLTFAAVVLGDRAGAWVGAVGFTAFALAFIGMTEGLRSFRDNCRSYLLGKLGTVYCGIMVAAWFLVFCVGLAKTM